MFFEASCFPSVVALEDNWEVIREEYDSISSGAIPYLEEDLYRGEWDVFPLIAFGKKDERRCELCPKTWELVKDIPGLTTASFSVLGAYTEIHPHTGFTNKVLRCHLGLKIPHGCAIIVGEQARRWQEGKCLIFDDTIEHSAYNKNDEDRVVLLLDFKK